MTVQNQNVKNVYRGNGSAIVFPFTFAINKEHPEYIHVYITDDGGKAVETTDFTCDMDAKTITYPKTTSSAAKLSSTQRLTIYRLLPYTQELNLVNQGPFFAEDVETELDDLEMQIQQMSENLARCFQIGVEAVDFDMTMELEPDKVICVNSAGNGFEAREALMEVNGVWNGEGRRIVSVADPISAQDVLTRHYYDKGIDNMLHIAGIVTDSGELQHIVNQFNTIDTNTQKAVNAANTATAKEASATASATSAAGSATSATNTANALVNFLESKETLTAPAVDTTLTVAGAAADAKVTGEKITVLYSGELDTNSLDLAVGSLYSSGGFNPSITNRVATQTTQIESVDVTIYPANGFKIYIYYFDAGGTKTYQSGWLTDAHTIPANTYFRFVIARVDEITETANINTFVKDFVFAVPIEKQIVDTNERIDETNDRFGDKLDSVYDGDYVPMMESTAGVVLNNVSVGSVVDLSSLQTAGSHHTILIENVAGGECFYLNITDGTVRLPWAFLDKDKKLLSVATTSDATTTELIAPTNAKYLLVQCGNAHFANAKLIRYASFSDYQKSISITAMNEYTDMVEKLENASNVAKRDTSTAVKSRNNIINFLHFSDVHGSVENIERILRFNDEYKTYISDVLFTGDSVTTYYENANPFASVGGDTVLNVVGNHECWHEGSTWPTPYDATAQEVYTKFFAPYISSWNVTSAGENLCYYYKDYSNGFRLIVLDAIHWDATQLAWFTNVLDSARSSSLAVIVAEHYPAQSGLTKINCTFNEVGSSIDAESQGTNQMERLPDNAFDAVDSFITSGGEFVCWLCGHTHGDFIGVVNNHTNQIQVIISCALTSNRYSECARTPKTKTQDLFNVFTADKSAKLIKLIRVGSTMDKFMRSRQTLCINYSTKEVISNN